MQSKISDDFWSAYEHQINALKQRFESLPSTVSAAKRMDEYIRRNLSDSSKKRTEVEKLLEILESKISFLEKKSLKGKRKRAKLDPVVQALLDRISDNELKEYIIIHLFKPDYDADPLLSMCKIMVDLPDAKEGDNQVFGKKIDPKTPFAEELKKLENKIQDN